jgi:hypothetical protein
MPSTPSLKAMTARRVALQAAIDTQRVATAALVTRVASPVQKLDQLQSAWRRLPTFAIAGALPLGWFVQRIFPQAKVLGTILRWSPAALGALRVITAMTAQRPPASVPPPPPSRPEAVS